MICRREIGVAVNETPLAVNSSIDMGDSNRHRRRPAAVHDDFANLEADSVSQITALEADDVLRH